MSAPMKSTYYLWIALLAHRHRLIQTNRALLQRVAFSNSVNSFQKKDTNNKTSKNVKGGSAPNPNQAAQDVYHVPEYYKHDGMTYYDMEIVMEQDRLKQPSSLKI